MPGTSWYLFGVSASKTREEQALRHLSRTHLGLAPTRSSAEGVDNACANIDIASTAEYLSPELQAPSEEVFGGSKWFSEEVLGVTDDQPNVVPNKREQADMAGEKNQQVALTSPHSPHLTHVYFTSQNHHPLSSRWRWRRTAKTKALKIAL